MLTKKTKHPKQYFTIKLCYGFIFIDGLVICAILNNLCRISSQMVAPEHLAKDDGFINCYKLNHLTTFRF